MKSFSLFFILILAAQLKIVAQGGSCFTLDKASKRYCVGEEIKITNCISPPVGQTYGKIAEYYFDYDNIKIDPTSPSDVLVTHIYNIPGKYKIFQRGGRKAPLFSEIDTSSQYVEILPIQVPKFDIGLCEGFKVQVDFTDGVYKSYTINNGIDPAQIVSSTPAYTYTYTDASSRSISVQGECSTPITSANFNPIPFLIPPDVLSQTAQTYSAVPPKDSAIVLLNAVQNMKYKLLHYQANSWNIVRTLSGLSGIKSLPKIFLDSITNYIAVTSYDVCGTEDTAAKIIIPYLRAKAINNLNQVSWTAIDPQFVGQVQSIIVYRNGVNVATLPASSITFDDPNINCGRKYEYQVELVSNLNNALNGQAISSKSIVKSVTSISSNKPPAITVFDASIQGGKVFLSWKKPNSTVKNYTLKKSMNGGLFKFSDYAFFNTYTDYETETRENKYCYKISYADSCGNQSDDSLITCSILLLTQKNDDDTHTSNWTPYQNGTAPTENYSIEIYGTNNSLINTIALNAIDTTYINTMIDMSVPKYRYRIKLIKTSNPTFVIYSNFTEIKNDIKLYFPDIFSPNQDGENDVYTVKGKYFKDFTISIFNRWGELIFYSQDINKGWDGKYNGSDCTEGLYMFVVKAINNDNESYDNKGTIILKR